MTAPAHALLRPQPARTLIAVAMILGHLASVGLAVVLLIWLFAPLLFALLLGVLAAACIAAAVVLQGRWSRGPLRAVQAGAVLVLLASYAALAVVAIVSGADAVGSVPVTATPPAQAAAPFVVAAIALAALCAVMAAIPLPLRSAAVRRVAVVLAAIGAAAGLVAATAVGAGGDPCEDFRFDPARWRASLAGPDPPGRISEAELIARAVVRCRSVNDARRTRVRRLLGPPHVHGKRTWRWSVGTTNDALGPGDERVLSVGFGSDGRVRRVSL